MEQVKTNDDEFLKVLEVAVRAIIKGKKSKPEHKLAAIREGVKLEAIRHRINQGGDQDEGFFK